MRHCWAYFPIVCRPHCLDRPTQPFPGRVRTRPPPGRTPCSSSSMSPKRPRSPSHHPPGPPMRRPARSNLPRHKYQRKIARSNSQAAKTNPAAQIRGHCRRKISQTISRRARPNRPAPPFPFCPRFARACYLARHLVHHSPVCLKTIAAPSTPIPPGNRCERSGVISPRVHRNTRSPQVANKRTRPSPRPRSVPVPRRCAGAGQATGRSPPNPNKRFKKIARPNPGSPGRHAKLHERIMPQHARTRDGCAVAAKLHERTGPAHFRTQRKPEPNAARPARPRSAGAPVSARPLLHRPPACQKNVPTPPRRLADRLPPLLSSPAWPNTSWTITSPASARGWR